MTSKLFGRTAFATGTLLVATLLAALPSASATHIPECGTLTAAPNSDGGISVTWLDPSSATPHLNPDSHYVGYFLVLPSDTTDEAVIESGAWIRTLGWVWFSNPPEGEEVFVEREDPMQSGPIYAASPEQWATFTTVTVADNTAYAAGTDLTYVVVVVEVPEDAGGSRQYWKDNTDAFVRESGSHHACYAIAHITATGEVAEDETEIPFFPGFTPLAIAVAGVAAAAVVIARRK